MDIFYDSAGVNLYAVDRNWDAHYDELLGEP